MICPRCGHDNVPGNDVCESCLLDLAPLDQPAPRDRVQHDLMDRPVRDLKPRPSITLPGTALLGDAVKLMLDRGVHQLPVMKRSGRSHDPIDRVNANSEVRNDKTFGVLELTLHNDRYDWRFVPAGRARFSDSGSDRCH